uniref:Uncharacterized protein n=1 Tax=Melanopsichium pennsylvanicum 4 TaxID=1398559 RepID=A0A077R6B9_9BASI|nr:uncharacterized protein BN887_00237 [Melanopsichium pennsylvanicum 4]
MSKSSILPYLLGPSIFPTRQILSATRHDLTACRSSNRELQQTAAKSSAHILNQEQVIIKLGQNNAALLNRINAISHGINGFESRVAGAHHQLGERLTHSLQQQDAKIDNLQHRIVAPLFSAIQHVIVGNISGSRQPDATLLQALPGATQHHNPIGPAQQDVTNVTTSSVDPLASASIRSVSDSSETPLAQSLPSQSDPAPTLQAAHQSAASQTLMRLQPHPKPSHAPPTAPMAAPIPGSSVISHGSTAFIPCGSHTMPSSPVLPRSATILSRRSFPSFPSPITPATTVSATSPIVDASSFSRSTPVPPISPLSTIPNNGPKPSNQSPTELKRKRAPSIEHVRTHFAKISRAERRDRKAVIVPAQPSRLEPAALPSAAPSSTRTGPSRHGDSSASARSDAPSQTSASLHTNNGQLARAEETRQSQAQDAATANQKAARVEKTTHGHAAPATAALSLVHLTTQSQNGHVSAELHPQLSQTALRQSLSQVSIATSATIVPSGLAAPSQTPVQTTPSIAMPTMAGSNATHAGTNPAASNADRAQTAQTEARQTKPVSVKKKPVPQASQPQEQLPSQAEVIAEASASSSEQQPTLANQDTDTSGARNSCRSEADSRPMDENHTDQAQERLRDSPAIADQAPEQQTIAPSTTDSTLSKAVPTSSSTRSVAAVRPASTKLVEARAASVSDVAQTNVSQNCSEQIIEASPRRRDSLASLPAPPAACEEEPLTRRLARASDENTPLLDRMPYDKAPSLGRYDTQPLKGQLARLTNHYSRNEEAPFYIWAWIGMMKSAMPLLISQDYDVRENLVSEELADRLVGTGEARIMTRNDVDLSGDVTDTHRIKVD